ncbi:MAG: DoxX family protein [Gemmatimonadota bacterium]
MSGTSGIRTKLLKVLRSIIGALPTVLRLLLGFILLSNGWRWLHRPDAGAYLTENIQLILDRGGSVAVYRPFLTGVVLPNVGLFAWLVSWGEFLSGVSLFFGLASRVGAAVAAFLFLNYGLMGGPGMSFQVHGILILILFVTVKWQSGRRFGGDRFLHRRWPSIKVW